MLMYDSFNWIATRSRFQLFLFSVQFLENHLDIAHEVAAQQTKKQMKYLNIKYNQNLKKLGL